MVKRVIAAVVWGVAWVTAGAGMLAEMPATPPRPEAIDNESTYPMLTPEQFEPNPSLDLEHIRQIKGRLREHYLDALRRRPATDAADLLSRLTPEGAFPDIDYSVRAKMFFPQFPHLQRISAMTLAYHTPGHELSGSERLLDGIRRALAHWCRVNPQTDHHWYIEIGAPMEMLPTLMLMESSLSRDDLSAALPLLRASYRNGLFRFGAGEATGANMMWVARMNLEAGLLEEDPFDVARAARRFEQEIKVTLREGVQPDWSFTQHGRQLYAAGYGGSYAADSTLVAWYLRDTRFAFDPRRMQIIANYVLHGQQWMMRGRHWISGPRGRELSRRLTGPAEVNPVTVPLSVGERLADLVPAQRDPLIAAGKRMTGKVPPDTAELIGNRMFWRVDLMTHHRPGWMAAVRMASDRVVGTESGNTENLLGHHLADGVVEVLQRGDEYRGVWPLWNWRQLPGTTVAQVDTPLPEHQWGKGATGTTAFVGGVSDGTVGAAAMDFDRDGVKVKKSWFFTPVGMVARGSGLVSTAGAEVLTTVNQCWRRGKVLIGTAQGTREAPDGTTTLTGPAWVLHDGIGYVIPAGQTLRLVLEARSGSWHTINRTQSKDEVRGEVFTLAIEHGGGPGNAIPAGTGYGYVVLPGASSADLMQWLGTPLPPPGDNVHLWEQDGRILAVFWGAGEVQTSRGVLSASGDCAVVISGDRASVSNPAAETGTLRLALGDRAVEVTLPEGPLAGSSVSVPLP